MPLTQIRNVLKRISLSRSLREFFRGFLSTEELLPLTLEDICRICPMSSSRGNTGNPEMQDNKKVDECRKRYFAALLQSYLGKPGDQETDWLYSYARKCEGCYLRRFIGADTEALLKVGRVGKPLPQRSQGASKQQATKGY